MLNDYQYTVGNTLLCQLALSSAQLICNLRVHRNTRTEGMPFGVRSKRHRLYSFKPQLSHNHQFLVNKLFDAEIGEFMAITGAFNATERELWCGAAEGIDKHHTGFNA